tara:strand:+ start:330 stop:494 length:165 start_codon:yes stop_codon:yes gene_type:complete
MRQTVEQEGQRHDGQEDRQRETKERKERKDKQQSDTLLRIPEFAALRHALVNAV